MSDASARATADAIVIGAGFYGLSIAAALADAGRQVTVLERELGVLRRASTRNQARVHGGYHYPRSLRTAMRSQINYSRFIEDHRAAVDEQIQSVYAIARVGSHVNASQFARFCGRIGAPVTAVDPAVAALFDPDMIDGAFAVREATFNADRLAADLLSAVETREVRILLGTDVERVSSNGKNVRVTARTARGTAEYSARDVLSCAYAGTADLIARSGLAPMPLQFQETEMALVQLPTAFQALAITVMDGPFFSVVPYPPRPGLHTLSHVRFTARIRRPSFSAPKATRPEGSAFPYMISDARRFIPALADAEFVESILETKVVPVTDDSNDGRPILVHRPEEVRGLALVVGGKVDNVYDVIDELVPVAGMIAS
jgi:glycine/D-amino acid oxidase-like deaminating enzyme